MQKDNENKTLKMTDEDEANFQKATKCHICYKQDNDTDFKVRDHCHITGKFRGASRSDCN